MAPTGVARSSSAPTQTSGLTRSGSVELMLPSEARPCRSDGSEVIGFWSGRGERR